MTRRTTSQRSRSGTATKSHGGTATMSRSEAGRKGAEARWGKSYSTKSRPSSRTLSRPLETRRTTHGTTPRASAACYSNELLRNSNNNHSMKGRSASTRRNVTRHDEELHRIRSEAGRRGAEARWGNVANYRNDNLRTQRSYPRNQTETRWNRFDNQYDDHEDVFFIDLDVEGDSYNYRNPNARKNHTRDYSPRYEATTPRTRGSRNVYGRNIEQYEDYEAPSSRMWNVEDNEKETFSNTNTRRRNTRR